MIDNSQTMAVNKWQSLTIDVLRLPLAVMVVFIHSSGIHSMVSWPYWADKNALQTADLTIWVLLSHVVSHVAVPTFYLLSGFLFFYGVKEFTRHQYFNKLYKRLHSLVIPYLLWCLIPIVWLLGKALIKSYLLGIDGCMDEVLKYVNRGGVRLLWDINIWGGHRTNWIGMVVEDSGPILIPLWFLRDLIVVVLFTPLLYMGLKKMGGWLLSILGFCYISQIWFPIHGVSITAFFFFSIGACFSINGKNLVEEMMQLRYWAWGLCIPLLVAEIYFFGGNTPIGYFIFPFFVIVGVVSIITLTATFVQRGGAHSVVVSGSAVFFIYVFHQFLGLKITNSLLDILFSSPCNPLLLTIRYLLTAPLCVVLCIGVWWGLKKCCPALAMVLTGARK